MTPSGAIGHALPVYSLHGLRIRSDVPLVGFAADGLCRDVDVDVASSGVARIPAVPPDGAVLASFSSDGKCLYVAAGDRALCTLRVPGVCDFLIDRGAGRVECVRDPTTDPRLVGLLVTGLVLAFLLGLEGEPVLHASAVELDGSAVAFAGPSGAGKTTLAAVLCTAGGRIVTDDLLRLRPEPAPVCVGGSPQLRLRRSAAWALDGFPTPPADDVTVDDRLALTCRPTEMAEVPLSVICLPRAASSATAVSVERLGGAASVAALAGVTRVAGWQGPDVLRAHFAALAAIAEQVPVVDLLLPLQGGGRRDLAPRVLEAVSRFR